MGNPACAKPNAAADQDRITVIHGMLSLQRPRLLSLVVLCLIHEVALMDVLLSIATLLGGVAAVVYFWEKRNPGWLSHVKSLARAPASPLDPGTLFAYANSHPRPLGLTRTIAERRGLKLQSIDSESAWLNEQIQILGIKTVRELDGLVKKHASVASRLTDYSSPQQPIDSGFIIGAILEVVAIERGGKEGLRRFFDSLKYSSRGSALADEKFRQYKQIRLHG